MAVHPLDISDVRIAAIVFAFALVRRRSRSNMLHDRWVWMVPSGRSVFYKARVMSAISNGGSLSSHVVIAGVA